MKVNEIVYMYEKAPPGREKQVKHLKKEFCGGKDDCPRAYATAWASYNKSHRNVGRKK